MNRLALISGLLVAALGGGCIIPALIQWISREAVEGPNQAVMALGLILILGGAFAIWAGFRSSRGALASIPAPVRAVMAANVFFLAFCALETSDGLLRQGGRVVYWTTALFVPALVVFYWQVFAKGWAWWVVRILTVISTLWFLGFIALIPFVDLRTSDGPVPWWGRLYMVAVSLVFAGISAYAFCSLGHAESRRYFGLGRRDKQAY